MFCSIALFRKEELLETLGRLVEKAISQGGVSEE
jgi:hypothetical protein